jgi:MFS family permease
MRDRAVRLTAWNARSHGHQTLSQFLGLVAAVPALGPFISGTLVDLLSWRWLFIVPLVLPATALVVLRLGVPETPRARTRLDVGGAVLLTVALGALSVALVVGATATAPLVPIAALAIALLAGIGFVTLERRVPDPLLPLRLLRHRRFVGGNLVWLIGCLTSWGAVFFTAVMLQTTLGEPPFVAGIMLTPIYLTMMIGSPASGRLAERYGPAPPILAGLAVYIGGLVLLSRLGPGSDLFPETLLAIEVFAVGMALFSAPLAAVTLSAVGEAEQGIASGLNNAVGQLAGLLAIIVLPAAAGLGGVALGDPSFAAGYAQGLLAAAAFAAVGLVVAAWTLIRWSSGGEDSTQPLPRSGTATESDPRGLRRMFRSLAKPRTVLTRTHSPSKTHHTTEVCG